MQKRLHRSRDERMIAGVSGGLAEYFDIDPSILRILWLVALFTTGPVALFFYVVCAMVIPTEREASLL
jgi:phage shock protein C